MTAHLWVWSSALSEWRDSPRNHHPLTLAGSVVDLESPVAVTLGMRITEDGDLTVLRDDGSGFATIDALTGETVALMNGQDPSPLTTEGGFAILGSNGRFASTLDPDMRYRVYPSAGGSPVYTAPEGWVIVGISDDALLVVIYKPAEPNLRLITTADEMLVAKLDAGPAAIIATFSPDSRYVITNRRPAC